MSNAQLETAIEAAWEARDTITPATTGETREAIEDTLAALDSGSLRVAERQESGDWHVNQWAKKAVLLGFRIKDMEQQAGGPQGGGWWDKVDSKFIGWGDNQWKAAGFRAVPSAVVRRADRPTGAPPPGRPIPRPHCRLATHAGREQTNPADRTGWKLSLGRRRTCPHGRQSNRAGRPKLCRLRISQVPVE